MKEFDNEFSKLVKESKATMPQSMSEHIDGVLVGLNREKAVSHKRRRRTFFLPSTGIAVVVLLSFLFNNQLTVAFGKVREFVGDIGILTYQSSKPPSEHTYGTITQDGERMTIQDVFYDGVRLVMSYERESDKSLEPFTDIQLEVNKQEVPYEAIFHSDISGNSHKREMGYIFFSPASSIDSDIQLSMRLQDAREKNWSFDFKVNSNQLSVPTITPNIKKVDHHTEFTVNNIHLAESALKVDASMVLPIRDYEKEKRYIHDFRIKNGQKVLSIFTGNQEIYTLDENGKKQPFNEEIIYDDSTYIQIDYTVLAEPVKSVEKLVIEPLIIHDKSATMKNITTKVTGKYPIELEDGQNTIYIENIESNKENTIIHYRVEGFQPSRHTNFHLKDLTTNRVYMTKDEPIPTGNKQYKKVLKPINEQDHDVHIISTTPTFTYEVIEPFVVEMMD